jgi:hypothetical protein
VTVATPVAVTAIADSSATGTFRQHICRSETG